MSAEDPAGGSGDASASGGPRNNSSSIRRALQVLSLLAAGNESRELTLAELAKGLGVHRSSALRVIAPLIEAGLLRYADPERHRYALGPETMRLGQIYVEGLDLRRLALPTLRGLARHTAETVHLVAVDPPSIVYVAKIDSERPVRMHSRVGDRQPMHSTANGKAYLAFAPEAELVAVIAHGLPARTENTKVSERALREELDAVRAAGFAIDDQENELEIRCVAAPIRDHTGALVAGVSVSAPASRLSREQATELGPEVIAVASEISQNLGYSVTSGGRPR